MDIVVYTSKPSSTYYTWSKNNIESKTAEGFKFVYVPRGNPICPYVYPEPVAMNVGMRGVIGAGGKGESLELGPFLYANPLGLGLLIAWCLLVGAVAVTLIMRARK